MSLIVSKEGFESMERELESLKQQLTEQRIYKNKIAVENGNVWHDNSDFEQAEIEERLLMKSISTLKEKISNATIIDADFSKDIVSYGAKVDLHLICEDEKETITILLSDSDEKSNLDKISLNSPLGKVIYKQKVGYEGKYTVKNDTFTVKILKIEY